MNLKMLAVIIVIMIVACSTQTRNEVRNEFKNTQGIKNQYQLKLITHKHIQNATNLNASQKKYLLDLFADIYTKEEKINSKLRKNKLLLYKNAVSKNFSFSKERILKGNIKSLEKDKYTTLVKKLEKTKEVLGHSESSLHMERPGYNGYRNKR